MDSCFDLVGSRQHGVASYKIFSWSADIHILTKMVITILILYRYLFSGFLLIVPLHHIGYAVRPIWFYFSIHAFINYS